MAPEARLDLLVIYNRIAKFAGAAVALDYIERSETYCLGFDLASQRGTLRNDIRPGLRIIGFERRVTVAFAVDDKNVTVLRLFYGGRDWDSAFL